MKLKAPFETCDFLRVLLLVTVFSFPAAAQQAPTAHQLLDKSIRAIGLPNDSSLVFRYESADYNVQDHQSDRTYPPFFSQFSNRETLFYPHPNMEAVDTRVIYPGYASPTSRQTLNTEQGVYLKQKDRWLPVPPRVSSDINLNPIAVLLRWQTYDNVTVSGKKKYRDFLRIVLKRPTADGGAEYLYIDPESFFPVKYETMESNYLWGDVRVEYLYSTWLLTGHTYFPGASFKIADGSVQVSRTHATMQFVSGDSLNPPGVPEQPADIPAMTASQKPDTIRIANNLYLLHNRWYNEIATLIDDTIYLLDATQGEQRAEFDHEWIRDLFPGDHPVVLVVTDLAWPHIGGLRYWVSQGASVYSHQTSQAFLQKVIDRRWEQHPDELEKKRKGASFRFTGVNESCLLANGKVQLYTIGGIGSEGALMVYLPEQRFLWASDFIQTVKQPAAYTNEVKTAVRRYGISPSVVAAEHLKPVSWEAIDSH